MVISTQHLLPPAPPPELPLHLKTLPPLSPQIPDGSQSASAVSPQPVQGGPLSETFKLTRTRKTDILFRDTFI